MNHGRKASETIAKIEEIAERVAQPEGIEIVEVELKGGGKHQVLLLVIDRVTADKTTGVTHTGVTHDDCELISRNVGAILDAEDVIKGTYQLEVSSPGVERKLLKWRDWERFVGEKAKVVLREPVPAAAHLGKPAGDLKYFEGVIASADQDTQSVAVTLPDGAAVTFPFGNVDRANLKFDW